MTAGISSTWRTIVYALALLLVQLAVACSPAQPDKEDAAVGAPATEGAANGASPAAAAAGPLVVAFGDSLFAGYGLDPGQGLVPQLQQTLSAEAIDAQVFNAAVSGDTTAAGLRRLEFTLEGLPKKPDLVIVGLGGNDMLRGLDPAETEANLAAILGLLADRQIPGMIAGMLAAPNMGEDYAEAFNPIYPRLAQRFNVPLYPFTLAGVAGNRELLLADGIHPNQQGVAVIAERLAPVVAAELRELAPAAR